MALFTKADGRMERGTALASSITENGFIKANGLKVSRVSLFVVVERLYFMNPMKVMIINTKKSFVFKINNQAATVLKRAQTLRSSTRALGQTGSRTATALKPTQTAAIIRVKCAEA